MTESRRDHMKKWIAERRRNDGTVMTYGGTIIYLTLVADEIEE